MELIIIKLSVLLVFMNALIALWNSLFRVKHDALFCGLFGFCGSKAPNMMKMRILGLYNQSRGAHSCGVYYNGEAHKGVDKIAKWEDFIQDFPIEAAKDAKVFIGHTRYATKGTSTAENAHPFVFDKIVGAHNGGIENYWQLAQRYGVDIKGLNVDSAAFIKIMGEVGFKVLEEYRGYAAFLLTLPEDPNTLYIFRGASKRLFKDDKMSEERPLFYIRQPEGIYVSSMHEALRAIRDTVLDKVFYVPENRVIKIKAGKFFHKDDILIDREDINLGVNHKITYPSDDTYHGTHYTPAIYRPNPTVPNVIPPNNSSSTGGNSNELMNLIQESARTRVNPIIFQESLPTVTPGHVVYHRGRYWESVGGTPMLMDGPFLIDRKRTIIKPSPQNKRGNPYYFFRGIMLKSKEAWEAVQERRRTGGTESFETEWFKNKNTARVFSRYSQFPVTNLSNEAVSCEEVDRFSWYIDGKLADKVFTPKFSNRHYHCKNGVLTTITSSIKKGDVIFYVGEEEPKKETPVTETKGSPNEMSRLLSKIATLPIKDRSNFTVDEKGTLTKDSYTDIGEEREIDPVNVEDIPAALRSLIKTYCDRTYSSIAEMDQDLPSTVIDAIGLYIDDLLMNVVKPDEYAREDVIEDFYNTVVTDQVTIREVVGTDYFSIDQYVHQIWLDEIRTEEEDTAKFEAIEADEVTNETEVEEENFHDKPVTFYDYEGDCCQIPQPMTLKEACAILKRKDYMVVKKDGSEFSGARVIDLPVREQVAHNKLSEQEMLNEMEEAADNVLARRRLEDILSSLDVLRKSADALQGYINSDLAQESTMSLYKSIDNTVQDLSDVFGRMGETELVKTVQSITSNA